jgi:hypothetical protein
MHHQPLYSLRPRKKRSAWELFSLLAPIPENRKMKSRKSTRESSWTNSNAATQLAGRTAGKKQLGKGQNLVVSLGFTGTATEMKKQRT